MIFSSFISVFVFLALTCARAAPRSKDSPDGVIYEATFDSKIFGNIQFFTYDGYVKAHVDLKNFPRRGGPWSYEIHERKVPGSGDCAITFGIFDPYHGDANPKTWALGKVGDLSGKHGVISSREYVATYFDPYLSLNPSNEAYFGDLSIVVRAADGQYYACTNIVKIKDGEVGNNVSNSTSQDNGPMVPGLNVPNNGTLDLGEKS